MKTNRALTLAAAVLAAACSGNNDAEPGPQTPPSLSFALFDAPPEGVTSVRLSIAAIQVHVDGLDATATPAPEDASIDNDGKWKSLPVDAVIDLVQHQGEAAAKNLGEIRLPEGKITQLRLLVDKTKPNQATWNGADCDLDLSKINDNGIKVNHAFKAVEARNDDHLGLYVDFDLGQSLKQQGSCFEVRPVLKLAKAVKNGTAQEL